MTQSRSKSRRSFESLENRRVFASLAAWDGPAGIEEPVEINTAVEPVGSLTANRSTPQSAKLLGDDPAFTGGSPSAFTGGVNSPNNTGILIGEASEADTEVVPRPATLANGFTGGSPLGFTASIVVGAAGNSHNESQVESARNNPPAFTGGGQLEFTGGTPGASNRNDGILIGLSKENVVDEVFRQIGTRY